MAGVFALVARSEVVVSDRTVAKTPDSVQNPTLDFLVSLHALVAELQTAVEHQAGLLWAAVLDVQVVLDAVAALSYQVLRFLPNLTGKRGTFCSSSDPQR